MTTWYVDTSAALKLILREPESASLIEAIAGARPALVGSNLLETELRRAAHRSTVLTQRHVSGLLARFSLYDVPAAVFTQAGLLPGASLRSLDALHLASAMALEVDAVVTYDHRLAEAATDVGLPVLAPR